MESLETLFVVCCLKSTCLLWEKHTLEIKNYLNQIFEEKLYARERLFGDLRTSLGSRDRLLGALVRKLSSIGILGSEW